LTLVLDFDGRTGVNAWAIDVTADPTSYAAGCDFIVMITTGTVGGVSAVGYPVAAFSIENRNGKANVTQWNSVNVVAPATAGIPDVNAKNLNNVSAAAITAINANLGTTQPINFTGTGASALAKGDAVDIGGVAQTGLDIAANYTAARATKLDNLDAAVTTRMATFTLPTNFSSLGIGVTGHISIVDTLTTYSGNTPQTGDLYAVMTGVNTELSSPPAITASIINMLKWLFTKAKNKRTQTSTTELLRNDADNAIIGTSVKSDDGTVFTRGKYS